MKAIRVHVPGGPEALRYEDVPDPSPKAGEALVRVEAAGVNFIEVYFRTGVYKPAGHPFTPGGEAAGVVEAVGPGVTEVGLGDRVATVNAQGSYAERTLVVAARLVRVPDGVTTRQAAAVMLQGMTAHYLATSTRPLSPGDTCLVHAAAGGAGLFLCAVAKRRGARVIGTVSTPEKAALARRAGADEVILYTQTDFVAETKRLTDGKGVQAVFDSVGKTTFEKGLDVLAPRGTMVLFGQSSGAAPSVDPQILNAKGSVFLTRPSLFHYVASREELLARASDVLGWVKDGTLPLRVDREVPLAHAAAAHRALEARETAGKVLLIPG
ncbi:MAG: quinone oxidoreductase [Thermoanaerobaculia bacterium]